ncbi:MAG: sulfite exporter TauE/SafE family protein [Flavobacteriales bacterium]
MDLNTFLLLTAIGLAAGALSGFVGIGGGVVMVPALIYFLNFNQLEAQGTSLAVMLPPIGILAFMNYHKTGNVDIRNALVIAGMFIVGGYLGSKLALRLPVAKVKLFFGVLMVFVSVRMVWSAVQQIWGGHGS